MANKKVKKETSKKKKIVSDFSLELSYLKQGLTIIGGIDEVGRGCLAGPVVASVVAVSGEEQFITGVKDSKQMTEKQREDKYDEIREISDGFGIGQASNDEIDKYGIVKATRLAMLRAYRALDQSLDIVLIDGRDMEIPDVRSQCIVKGDAKHFVISAASVLAKVYRDRMMKKLAEKYDVYGFDRNVGYGTKEHRDALDAHGFCDIHRKSFSPVKDMVREMGRGK
jgi:ribonuclease HII